MTPDKIEFLDGWTDYPIAELGDTPGKIAPIRRAKAISSDRDKYLEVIVEGVRIFIKAGYFYAGPGRAGQVRTFSWTILNRLPETQY